MFKMQISTQIADLIRENIMQLRKSAFLKSWFEFLKPLFEHICFYVCI